MKKSNFVLMLASLLCLRAAAQSVVLPVKGTVISTVSGEGIADVNIFLKKSNINLKTKTDGSFDLGTVSLPDTLICSHISYQGKQIPLPTNSAANLVISLNPSSSLLQEVTVNTGYESLPKERVTGSFVKIDRTLLERRISTGLMDRLRDVSSSMLFYKINNQESIQIRGLSTLFANTRPLIILDNFPYEGEMDNINPNDIEDITILRDAAAASIWGARAGNGVIVITSKKALAHQPPRLEINSNLTISQKPDLFDLRLMAATDIIDIERFLFDRGAFNADLANNFERPAISAVVEILAMQRSGQITAEEANRQINELRQIDVRSDFLKYIYRPSRNQQYSLRFSGGSKEITYALSAGYDKNLQNLRGNGYERITLNFQNSITSVRNLELSSSIMVSSAKSTTNSPGEFGGFQYSTTSRFALMPYSRLADDEGNALAIPRQYRMSFLDTVGNGQLLDWHYRPLDELKYADDKTRLSTFLLNLGATYKIGRSLKASIRYQLERSTTDGRFHRNENMYETRDLINRFTQINNGTPVYIVPRGGTLIESENQAIAHNLRTQLAYGRTINKHEINAIAGAEIRERTTESASGRVYGFDENTLTTALFDPITLYPLYPAIGGYGKIPTTNSFGSTLNRFVSVYTNAAYTFDKRYTVTASARKDASNLFGVKTNHKGRPLWSTGITWNIANENFYRITAILVLKFRITYGYSGNLGQDNAAVTTLRFVSASGNLNNVRTAYFDNLPNPTLRWEKVGTLNSAIDFGLRNNRLSGSIEYYLKNTKDLLGTQEMDPTTGISSMTTNSAQTKGNGFDLMLHGRIFTGAFTWDADFNYSQTSLKVTRFLRQTSTDPRSFVGSGSTLGAKEGHRIYQLMSYAWAGLDPLTGDPQGYLDHAISKDYRNILRTTPVDDLVQHGSSIPTKFGSFRNSFGWKGISLSANISYRLGYYFRKPVINYTSLYGALVGHGDYYKRWQAPGDEQHTSVPSAIFPSDANRDEFYAKSAVTALKADHIRLEDISLNYILPLPKTFALKNTSIYSYIGNLNILLWKANRENIDPYFPNHLKVPISFSFGIKTQL